MGNFFLLSGWSGGNVCRTDTTVNRGLADGRWSLPQPWDSVEAACRGAFICAADSKRGCDVPFQLQLLGPMAPCALKTPLLVILGLIPRITAFISATSQAV